MSERWPDYAHFPATGAEFEHYVATLFSDLGYNVLQTPATNDFGADLILTDPETQKRIAVQAKFYNHTSLGNTPVQEVIASLPHWGAEAGWVVTNGRFSKNAESLARENGVNLIDNAKLNGLITQARSRIAGAKPRIEETLDNKSCTTTQPAQPKAPKEKTYNMQDIMIRWDCSRTVVTKEISRGMPMRKMSNGRWSITDRDLRAWENLLATELKQEQRQKVIAAIVVVLLFAIAGTAIVVLNPGYFR